MAKKYRGELNGNSFHRVTLTATVNDIILVLGKPEYSNNTGKDKVNFEWLGVTESGIRFNVYDYKEYRKLKKNEQIEFHIGGKDFMQTIEAKDELESDIKNIKADAEVAYLNLGSRAELDALNDLLEISDE